MTIGPPHILVLDDDLEMQSQIAKALAGHYRVISHLNPTRAIATLETDPDISVFITEQVMRFGNGLDMLEAARSMKPNVRRVMITNYSDLASIIPGLHSGAIQALAQKPATDQELLAAIAPHLLQQRATAPRRLSA
jgi:two-component system response regulator RegA